MGVVVVPCPPVIFQFFDNEGHPAVGGSVLTQVGGVNYPTYLDAAGNSPLPNPIPLNSRGEISTSGGTSSQLFVVPNTVYTFTLFDVAGNQLWSNPFVNGVQLTGAQIATLLNSITTQPILASFDETAAETSVGASIVNYTYPPYYADRYGTNTVPGVTAMDAAIQTAINAAAVNGGSAYLLGFNYNVTNALTVPQNVVLQGVGGAGSGLLGGTVLTHNVSAGTCVTLGSSTSVLSYGCGLRDLSILNTATTTAVTGVKLNCTVGAQVRNIKISGYTGGVNTGFEINGGTNSSFFNIFDNCYAEHCHAGYLFTDQGGGGATNTTFLNCSAFGDVSTDTTSTGMIFGAGTTGSSGSSSSIHGGDMEACGTGVSFNNGNPYGVNSFGQRFEGNTADINWGSGTPAGGVSNTFYGLVNPAGFSTTGSIGVNNFLYGQFINYVRINAPNYGTSNRNLAIAPNGTGMSALTTGNDNTGLGYQALNAITGAQASCTAVGSQALLLATGNDNSALGTGAGQANTSGNRNTFLGAGAGSTVTTGANVTCVGSNAAASSASAVNEFTLGDSATATLRCQVDVTVLSDARDKSDIIPMELGLDYVKQLKPSRWLWNTRDGAKIGIPGAGFIAQDLQALPEIPGLVYDVNPEKLEVCAAKLLPVVVKALQEVLARIEALENGG